jgi:hypothetical protein
MKIYNENKIYFDNIFEIKTFFLTLFLHFEQVLFYYLIRKSLKGDMKKFNLETF